MALRCAASLWRDQTPAVLDIPAAALALLTGDPAVLTGQVAYSLSLLRALDRPVRDLDGTSLVDGWQPPDFPVDRLRAP